MLRNVVYTHVPRRQKTRTNRPAAYPFTMVDFPLNPPHIHQAKAALAAAGIPAEAGLAALNLGFLLQTGGFTR